MSISSTEAEFYAASVAGLDVVCMRRFLERLGAVQLQPTVLFEDNQACIQMSVKSGSFKRAKHIDTRVYRLRELCQDGILVLVKVATDFQVADILTKGLGYLLFSRQRDTFLS